MLKDRPETFAPLWCIVKYAPGAWNCGAPNTFVLTSQGCFSTNPGCFSIIPGHYFALSIEMVCPDLVWFPV